MIKFYIPGFDFNKPSRRASYRFRATIPLQGMRPEDGIITKISQAQKIKFYFKIFLILSSA